MVVVEPDSFRVGIDECGATGVADIVVVQLCSVGLDAETDRVLPSEGTQWSASIAKRHCMLREHSRR